MTMNNEQQKTLLAQQPRAHALRSRLAKLAAASLLLTAGMALFALPATAQHKDAAVRLVQGTVTDKDDKPLSNAVVYLKDEKSLQVKSYLTDDQGHFRFGQLSMANDYEIWADHSGTHSKTKHISSFNSKATVDYSLKID